MGERGAWASALAGTGVSLLCLLVWAGAARLGRAGGSRRFLSAHLGGVGARLLLAGALTAWALAGSRVRPGIFLASLVGSYTLLMIFEVFWLVRQRRRAGGAPAGPGGVETKP